MLMPAIQSSLQLHNIVAGKLSPFVLQADALDRAQEVIGGDVDSLVMLEEVDEGSTDDEDVIVLDEPPAVTEIDKEVFKEGIEARIELSLELLEEIDPDPLPTSAHAVGNGSSQVVKQASPASKYD